MSMKTQACDEHTIAVVLSPYHSPSSSLRPGELLDHLHDLALKFTGNEKVAKKVTKVSVMMMVEPLFLMRATHVCRT